MRVKKLAGGNVVPIKPPAAPAWRLPEDLEPYAVGGSDLLATDDGEDRFVVDRVIGLTDLVLLTGREKEALKTWAVLDLAIARVLGASWLGFALTPCPPARVLIVSAETSLRHVARRIKALCAGRGVDPMSVVPFLYVVDEPISLVPRAERQRTQDKADLSARLQAVRIYDDKRRSDLQRAAEAIAEREVDSLGRNLDALEAVESSPAGTWGLVIFDTLRQCLEGDENSSRDAARLTQASRELARAAGCPVVLTHHTNKGGDGSDARSSRGSVELTAGPDTLISIDTSGDHPTAHFRCRNHEAPEPVGYLLVPHDGGGLRLERREPSTSGKGGKVGDDEVLEVLRTQAPEAVSLTRVRQFVSEQRGSKPGSKVSATSARDALDRLVKIGVATKVPIKAKGGKEFDGWRIGKDSRPARAVHLGRGPLFGGAEDV